MRFKTALTITLALSMGLANGVSVMAADPKAAKGTGRDAAVETRPKTGALSKADSGKVFAELSDRFMKESLARSPSSASQAGYHQHKDPVTGKTLTLDAMLDDMSLKARLDDLRFYKKWRQTFEDRAPAEGLGPQDRADRRLVMDQIDLALLDLEEIQSYRHNPTQVVELIGSAIFQPLSATYASEEARLGHVIERIKQIPRALSQVKEYLDDCPAVYIETAIKENAGNISLIKETVAKRIEEHASLEPAFDKAAPAAISALESFSKWLKDDLAKRDSDRSWRLGKELYNRKFALVMQTEVEPETLLHDAEREMERVRAEMFAIALRLHWDLFPDADLSGLTVEEKTNRVILEVLDKVGEEHPKRDKLIEAVKGDLEKIREFIRQNRIVSLSKRNNLEVIPTPAFMRGIYAVAGFHSAPPLEPEARAEYWVTPIDPSTPEKAAESKLREYNNYTLKWLTIHEALPGHYIQFEHLNNIMPERRRLLRSLYGNGAYIEGWAEYIAQVMMDEGFMKDDPRFRLTMRKIRLRLLANTILDIKMHTMKMTDEQALSLMKNRAFQTAAEAEGKLVRAKLSSTQLPTYYVGLRQWQGFRKRYEEKAREFDMLEFHNRALDQGPLPVEEVESLLL